MSDRMSITADHEQWATPKQVEYIRAILAADGNIKKAAKAIGKHHNSLYYAIDQVLKKAALGGYAPGHFQSGVAPGYAMGKVTIQRDSSGFVERTWERQSPDDEVREAAIRAAFEGMSAELPREKRRKAPEVDPSNELLNHFTFSDYHMGMLAWHKETGADWDLAIAEDMLYKAFERLLDGAPEARVGMLNQLGDFLHTDGFKAVTPEHGHLLDADGRFPKIVAAVVRVLRRIIRRMLDTHDEVHVILAEGNHDMVSSIWLRTLFSALYENEPRVTIDDSAYPYYVYVWGETLLGSAHGHLAKGSSLPGLFAAAFRKEWGQTTRAYIHTGHKHHQHTQEFPGALVIQHSTLAAPDAYAARGGWMSDRQARRFTYHKRWGEVGSEVVNPQMLVAL